MEKIDFQILWNIIYEYRYGIKYEKLIEKHEIFNYISLTDQDYLF